MNTFDHLLISGIAGCFAVMYLIGGVFVPDSSAKPQHVAAHNFGMAALMAFIAVGIWWV